MVFSIVGRKTDRLPARVAARWYTEWAASGPAQPLRGGLVPAGARGSVLQSRHARCLVGSALATLLRYRLAGCAAVAVRAARRADLFRCLALPAALFDSRCLSFRRCLLSWRLFSWRLLSCRLP